MPPIATLQTECRRGATGPSGGQHRSETCDSTHRIVVTVESGGDGSARVAWSVLISGRSAFMSPECVQSHEERRNHADRKDLPS